MSRNEKHAQISPILFGKVVPQAKELEEAVLGACMLEKDTFERVMEILPVPECFYVDSNAHIYRAMQELYAIGSPVDLLTVTEQLRRQGTLESVGGAYALTTLTMSVMSTAHVEAHAMIVSEKYMARRLIRVCSETLAKAYSDEEDIFETLELAEQSVRDIQDGIFSDEAIPIGQLFDEMIDAYNEQQNRKSELIGIKTGLPEMDALTLGWISTDLIILAARTSQGKTAFALNFALNAAEYDASGVSGEPVLMFMLESSGISATRRLAAAKCGIPLESIRKGILSHNEELHLRKSEAFFRTLPIRIDSRSRKVSTIVKSIRKWKKGLPNGKTGMVIIDYLQLMSTGERFGNREAEVAYMSRSLKELATDLNIPIMALSQLNRDVEKTGNKRPTIAHIRESGAIEQDANVITLIWHEQLENDGIRTWLLVEKNREGMCGQVEVKLDGKYQKVLAKEDSINPVPISNISHGFQVRNPSEPKHNWDDEPF